MSEQPHVVVVLGRGLVPADTPVITADDLGFTRGDGCFDSLRVVTAADGTSEAVGLAEHLDRLDASADALGLAEPARPTRREWRSLVEEALAAWELPGEATLKLILSRGREWRAGRPTALVTISPVRRADPGRGPARALTAITLTRGHPSDAFADAPWLLGGVKTLSYVVNVAAQRVAGARGADDVIFTSTDGYALDGPTSGLLVASGGRLRSTPTEGTGILPSTSIERILRQAGGEGRRAGYQLIPVADLFTADGVWLVSSSRGPSPVTVLDGRRLAVHEELVATVDRLAGF